MNFSPRILCDLVILSVINNISFPFWVLIFTVDESLKETFKVSFTSFLSVHLICFLFGC